MANLKEIRVRIASVSSTKQITSAMKMVSAAKLKKAQNSILQLRPYALKMKEILSNLSASLDNSEDNPYAQNRTAERVCIIMISSNRGLCGAFNTNVGKKALSIAENDYSDLLASGKVDFVSVGKKAAEIVKHRGYTITKDFNSIFNHLSYNEVSSIAEEFMSDFVAKKYDRVILVYNQFKNAATQILTEEQFLPVEIDTENTKTNADYIFEPSKEFIVEDLIPKSLKTQFYKAILDSNASEHGARMIAMHKATDNAEEMVKMLKLNYNKARQAAITKEILEVVGGAEALNS